jgi:hypothetical protein
MHPQPTVLTKSKNWVKEPTLNHQHENHKLSLDGILPLILKYLETYKTILFLAKYCFAMNNNA